MKINKLWAAIMLLFMGACQSDTPAPSQQPKYNVPVCASLPDKNMSRAQIVYGTPKHEDGEIFHWNEKDWITVFNLTRLSECPDGEQLDVIKIDDQNADFEPVTKFDVKAGDRILAVFGDEVLRKYHSDETLVERDIFQIGVGAEANKPQFIVENPTAGSDGLEGTNLNFKMLAFATAVNDGEIPLLHFKHLSSIMRITLHNETGKDLYLTKLDFNFPGTEAFFNTTLYWSVETDDSDETIESTDDIECHDFYGNKLKIYTGDYLYTKGSKPYIDHFGTTINGKNGTNDIGEKIHTGDSYELYISVVPRFNNTMVAEKLVIDLIENHVTDNPYAITFDNFGKSIQAGMRYWFNLTATPDGKLMLTSKWNDLNKQPETPEGE